jgi:hypothetical protein
MSNEHYQVLIMHLILLMDETECDSWLQQNGVIVHMVKIAVATLEEFCGDDIICEHNNIWTCIPQTFIFGAVWTIIYGFSSLM